MSAIAMSASSSHSAPQAPVLSDIAIQQIRETVLRDSIQTITLMPDGVKMLDQTLLPGICQYVQIHTATEMVKAIHDMIVRGAPAIGIAGAYGVVLSVRQHQQMATDLTTLKQLVLSDAKALRESRPTAVNLMWAIDSLIPLIEQAETAVQLLDNITALALKIHEEDLTACISMGEYGASLIQETAPQSLGILTHCNAGGLATAGYGTAVGVIRSLYARDNTIQVFADETRPRLQGARLTAWELNQDHIPVTLICEGMAASLMRSGKVHAIVVGADRIAANGDTANKIGTYSLAIVAKAHQVPFYVVAPSSTFDMSLATGEDIPIEHRNPDEIAFVGEERICPEGIQFYNPAFDVTPANLITAIITEKGVAHPDFTASLAKMFYHA